MDLRVGGDWQKLFFVDNNKHRPPHKTLNRFWFINATRKGSQREMLIEASSILINRRRLNVEIGRKE